MGAVTPSVSVSDTGYVNPHNGVFGGVATATNNLRTDVASLRNNVQGCLFTRHYFGDVSTGDTWTSNIPNIVAVAWQPADATDDAAGVFLSAQATGAVGWIGTNAEGWLWVIHGS